MSKIQLLRALVSERLSVAAEEIFQIVERTLVEYEKDVSQSKWVVDHHHKLLNAEQLHNTDQPQVTAPAVPVSSEDHQPSGKWSPSLHKVEPEDLVPESPVDHQTQFTENPDSYPAQDENSKDGQKILADIENGDLVQTHDPNLTVSILTVKRPYKCPVCLESFSSEQMAQQHVQMHSDDKSSLLRCQFCNLCFTHKSDLVVHTRIHTGEKPHKCQHCHKCLAQKGNLAVHLRKHAGTKPCQCRMCGQRFNTLLALGRHVEKHSRQQGLLGNGERTPGSSRWENRSLTPESNSKTQTITLPPYDKSEFDQESLQPLCLYQVQAIDDIDKDAPTTLTVDNIKTKPSGEDWGVSEFTTDYQLPNPEPSASQIEQGESTGEMRERERLAGFSHLPVSQFLPTRKLWKACDVDVQFEIGTELKPYKCPHCSKCFSLTKTLIRHIKIHTDDRLYPCQFCQRNFCQKSDLVAHTRIHTGEKPYQCQECLKSFAQKSNLVVHMRKHTGEIPFICQKCGSCFKQKGALNRHMLIHT